MSSSTSSSDRRFLRRWLCTVAAVLILFACASEWLLRKHVAPQDNLLAHLSLLNTATSPDAAFGDSHVARGFAPPPGMLNLAFPSENIMQIAAKARRYYANHTPGRVIIQADPHLFSPYRLLAAADPTPPEPPMLMLLDPDRRRALRGYWLAFIKGRGALTSRIERLDNGALLSPGDLSGYSPRGLEALVRNRVRIHRPVSGPLSNAVAATKAAYAALLDDLSRKGAQLCLVSFPVSPPYRAMMARPAAEIIAFYQGEAARVGARYIDHRSLINEMPLFRDADHLNAAGALAYSSQPITACFDDPG